MHRWLLLLCSGCQLVFPLRDRAPADGGNDAPPQPVVGCTDPDLLACFQFEQNLTDGTDRNTLFSQSVVFPDGVDGKAVQTNGNSRLDFESPAQLAAETELTIETWIRVDEESSKDQLVVDLDGCWAMAITSLNRVKCYGSTTPVVAPVMLAPGVWTHVACTQVDDQVQVFVNGQLEETVDRISLKFQGCEQAALAGDAPNGGMLSPLTGSLDRFRIWNRTLTPIELKTEADAFLSH